jgi:hypothetical protein
MRVGARVLVVVAGLVATMAAAHGCTVFNGLVADVPDAASAVDANNAEASTSSSGDTNCGALPPARIAAEDGGLNSFVFAVTRFFLKESADGGSDALLGYNLDQRCGCARSCKPLGAAEAACDPDDRGIDNAAYGFLANTFADKIEGRANDNLKKGDNGLVVRVTDYNGTANDSTVQIELYTSAGTVVLPDGGGAPKRVPARFDGNDQWNQVSGTLVRVDGYVRDFVLVAPSVKATIRVDADIQMALTNGVLTAKIEPMGAGFALRRGVVAGHWDVEDALRQLGRLSSGPILLCENPLVFDPVRKVVCEAADLRRDGIGDEALDCNALSAAMGFEAEPAKLGPTVPAEISTLCDAGKFNCTP